jgi:hypothetical protein
MSDHNERRYYPRVKIKLPVVKIAGEGLVDGEIRDLSLGGAFIRCSAMPDVQDSFHMVISAEGRLMSITGEMVWSDIHKFNNETRLCGMGVRFKQIFNDDRRFLRDVIAKHHKNKLVAWLSKKT